MSKLARRELIPEAGAATSSVERLGGSSGEKGQDPGGADGSFAVSRAERLIMPGSVGANAVALQIHSAWGEYLVLSEFEQESEVAGVRFAGRLGIICHPTESGSWMLTSGAQTCAIEGSGFDGETPVWAGEVARHTTNELFTDTPRPAKWRALPPDVRPYVLIEVDDFMTGFFVTAVHDNSISIDRFPLTNASRFELEQVRFVNE